MSKQRRKRQQRSEPEEDARSLTVSHRVEDPSPKEAEQLRVEAQRDREEAAAAWARESVRRDYERLREERAAEFAYGGEIDRLCGVEPTEDVHPESGALGGADLGEVQQVRHNETYRSVVWFGQEHAFTKSQALVVEQLWEAWEKKTPDVADGTLLDAADRSSKSRLCDTFRGHPAWGTMIVSGKTKGTRRLRSPEN